MGTDRPLRIAQIAGVSFRVPPRHGGGTELVVGLLARGLAERGIRVTLFASGDSEVPAAALHSVVDRATQDNPASNFYLEKEYEVRNVSEAFARAADFDVLHAHWPTPAAYFSERTSRPTLLTFDYIEKPIFDYYRRRFPALRYCCVSRAQARALGADLPVVPNGIDVENVPFGGEPGRYLLTVGRLVPGKGADAAIRVARRAGRPLVIVGEVTPYLPESREFYRRKIVPEVARGGVHLIPRLGNDRVLELMSRAEAFLFPISWDEPFGLVVAEAMAAGTPVVATPRGSLPELVEPGVTGFLAETEDELVASVRRVSEIDRSACRRAAEKRFGYRRMAAGYEALYRALLAERVSGAALPVSRTRLAEKVLAH
jgi:glycosyltransferase involved in cell wall biosynthesis